MKFKYDYHMHTVYSDGKSLMEENVKEAIVKGFDEIAITDHGPGHLFFGIKETEILELRSEVDRLNEKYPGIKIKLGIEANILGLDGSIDNTDLIQEHIDILLAGYHFGSKPKVFWRDSKIHLYNILQKKLKCFRLKAKEMNTTALINAMRTNSIDILTHPGDKGPIDIEQIAKVAEETDTILEINEHHGHLSTEELKIAKNYDVKFIVSSDAHRYKNIGVFTKAIQRIKDAQIDVNRIVNYKGE